MTVTRCTSGFVTLLVLTDGRGPYLERTLASFEQQIQDAHLVRDRIIINDCLDPTYGEWIDRNYTFDRHIHSITTKRGFAGAIDAGWRTITQRGAHKQHYIFHLEDDFVFERPVNLSDLVEVMEQNRHLVQMAFRQQQPWNDQEIVEMWPKEYRDTLDDRGRTWLEHRLFFTTNPCIYPVRTVLYRWPQEVGSAAVFTARLLAADWHYSAFWGRRSDEPWVTRIGAARVGTGC